MSESFAWLLPVTAISSPHVLPPTSILLPRVSLHVTSITQIYGHCDHLTWKIHGPRSWTHLVHLSHLCSWPSTLFAFIFLDGRMRSIQRQFGRYGWVISLFCKTNYENPILHVWPTNFESLCKNLIHTKTLSKGNASTICVVLCD